MADEDVLVFITFVDLFEGRRYSFFGATSLSSVRIPAQAFVRHVESCSDVKPISQVRFLRITASETCIRFITDLKIGEGSDLCRKLEIETSLLYNMPQQNRMSSCMAATTWEAARKSDRSTGQKPTVPTRRWTGSRRSPCSGMYK